MDIFKFRRHFYSMWLFFKIFRNPKPAKTPTPSLPKFHMHSMVFKKKKKSSDNVLFSSKKYILLHHNGEITSLVWSLISSVLTDWYDDWCSRITFQEIIHHRHRCTPSAYLSTEGTHPMCKCYPVQMGIMLNCSHKTLLMQQRHLPHCDTRNPLIFLVGTKCKWIKLIDRNQLCHRSQGWQ